MNERDDTDRSPADREEPAADEVPTTPAPTVDPSPRRFLRSRDDRIIAGVAGGLGRYFDIDPVIIRIAFAISVLFGGLGVLAYLAVALFVPSDDGTGAPVEGGRGRDVARVLGVIAIAVVVFCGFGVLAAAGAFVTGLGFDACDRRLLITLLREQLEGCLHDPISGVDSSHITALS